LDRGRDAADCRGGLLLRSERGRNRAPAPTFIPIRFTSGGDRLRRLEVVETARRRRWTDSEKLRIVQESLSRPRTGTAGAAAAVEVLLRNGRVAALGASGAGTGGAVGGRSKDARYDPDPGQNAGLARLLAGSMTPFNNLLRVI